MINNFFPGIWKLIKTLGTRSIRNCSQRKGSSWPREDAELRTICDTAKMQDIKLTDRKLDGNHEFFSRMEFVLTKIVLKTPSQMSN